MTKVYRLELDACRNGRHDVCQTQTWTHLKCTCFCHQGARATSTTCGELAIGQTAQMVGYRTQPKHEEAPAPGKGLGHDEHFEGVIV